MQTATQSKETNRETGHNLGTSGRVGIEGRIGHAVERTRHENETRKNGTAGMRLHKTKFYGHNVMATQIDSSPEVTTKKLEAAKKPEPLILWQSAKTRKLTHIMPKTFVY